MTRDRAERPILRRRKKGSTGKLLLIALFVVGGGVAYLWKTDQLGGVTEDVKEIGSKAVKKAKEYTKDKPKTNKSKAENGNTTGGEPTKTTGGGDGGTTTEPTRIDPKDNKIADQRLAEAQEHFGQGRFKDARDVIDAYLKTSPAIDRSRSDKLREFRKTAFNHLVLTMDYQRDPRLDGETTMIEMVDGRKLEVRILERSGDRVKYLWKGIRSDCARDAIMKEEVIPRDKLRQRDEQRYGEKLNEAADGGKERYSARAFLAVIKYCVERDLLTKVPVVVQKAIGMQSSFFEDLFETKAAILYQRYLAFSRRGRESDKKEVYTRILTRYPDTTIGEELRRLSKESGGAPPKPDEEKKVIAKLDEKLKPRQTKTNSSKARSLLAKGDVEYARAMKEYRQAFPGQPNADRHLKVAWSLFKKAQKIYEDALAADPSNMAIEDKIAICQREIYSCQKQTKIN